MLFLRRRVAIDSAKLSEVRMPLTAPLLAHAAGRREVRNAFPLCVARGELALIRTRLRTFWNVVECRHD